MKKEWLGLTAALSCVVIPAMGKADTLNQLSFQKLCIEDGQPLSGATFALYNSAGQVVATATSQCNGTTVFSNIPNGEYTLVETKAPENYIPSTPMYVRMENGQTFVETTLDDGSNIFVYDAYQSHQSGSTSSSIQPTSSSAITSTTMTSATVPSSATSVTNSAEISPSSTSHTTSSVALVPATSSTAISSSQSTSIAPTGVHSSTVHRPMTSIKNSVATSVPAATTAMGSALPANSAIVNPNSTKQNGTPQSADNQSDNRCAGTQHRVQHQQGKVNIKNTEEVIAQVANKAAKQKITTQTAVSPNSTGHGAIVQQQLHVTPYAKERITICHDGYQQKEAEKQTLPQTGSNDSLWLSLLGMSFLGLGGMLWHKKVKN